MIPPLRAYLQWLGATERTATNLPRPKFLLERCRSFAVKLFRGSGYEDPKLALFKTSRKKDRNRKNCCPRNIIHLTIIETRRGSVGFRAVRAMLVHNIVAKVGQQFLQLTKPLSVIAFNFYDRRVIDEQDELLCKEIVRGEFNDAKTCCKVQ